MSGRLPDPPMQCGMCEFEYQGQTVVMINSDPSSENGTRPVPARHAIQCAELLIDCAFRTEPQFARRESVTPLASLLNALWRQTEYCLSSLLEDPECMHLRRFLDREIQRRVDEQLLVAREAARARGLQEAKAVIQRLVEIAGESSGDVRNIALAELVGELRRSLGDLGTVVR
jgi:hypothetical protein